MTGEWALLASVIAVCVTSIVWMDKYFEFKQQTKQPISAEEIESIKKEVQFLKLSYDTVIKTSEETKKLLSAANLASSLRGRQ